MRVFKSLAAGLFAAFALVTTAHATTIATFTISNGIVGVTETTDSNSGELLGSAFILSGAFNADATGLASLQGPPPALNFGATLTILPPLLVQPIEGGPEPMVFSGETGPVPLEFVEYAAIELLMIADILNQDTGGALLNALGYILDGEDRVDGTDTFDFGYGELFFTYGNIIEGPLTLSGTFSAIVNQLDLEAPSIPEIIAGILGVGPLGGPEQPPVGGLPVLVNANPGAPITNSLGFGFELELTIAAVPVPAGLPLLGAGLLGLVVLRRRRKAPTA